MTTRWIWLVPSKIWVLGSGGPAGRLQCADLGLFRFELSQIHPAPVSCRDKVGMDSAEGPGNDALLSDRPTKLPARRFAPNVPLH